MKHAMTLCSNNSFPGWRRGKQDVERAFLSVSSYERIVGVHVWFFRALQQANNCSLCLTLLCFLLLILYGVICTESPHNVPSSKGRKACFGALFETQTVESFCNFCNNPLKWFLANKKKRPLEANNARWGRPDGMRKVAAPERKTHDFPSDFSVFRGGDEQQGLDGLGAHILSIPSSRCHSIFMTSALWSKRERLRRDWLLRGFKVWGGGGGMPDMAHIFHIERDKQSLWVKHPAVMISLHRADLGWCWNPLLRIERWRKLSRGIFMVCHFSISAWNTVRLWVWQIKQHKQTNIWINNEVCHFSVFF